MNISFFDVVVVGAGPVGSTIAYYLKDTGLDVALVDKKRQIGHPLQCAGILSKHVLDFNELPDEVILNEVTGAFLHTKKYILKVEKDKTAALTIYYADEGETLWDIARLYCTSVEAVRLENNMTDDVIKARSMVLIPM